MKNVKIAIPSIAPGGLESKISHHFGHCELYTIVEINDNKIKEVNMIQNLHDQGGCLASVNNIHQNGVNVLISNGMGKKPLMKFQEIGIEVFYGAKSETVKDAVENFLQEKLQKFSAEYICKGEHHH